MKEVLCGGDGERGIAAEVRLKEMGETGLSTACEEQELSVMVQSAGGEFVQVVSVLLQGLCQELDGKGSAANGLS